MKGPKTKLFAFQDSLPRLPVPDLQATLSKYLRSVRPLATDTEYAHTEECVKKFVAARGPELQKQLQQYSDAEWAQGHNWLEVWWLQFAYLMWPDPLPLGSNVFFYFVTLPCEVNHIFQASRLLSLFLVAKERIDKEDLPVEFTGNLPMDMSQHKRAFTTARIPGENGDTLKVLPPSRDALVICCHRLYRVPVFDSEGKQLCGQVLHKQLQRVWDVAHSSMPRVKNSVAVLTSEKRPVWAKWRNILSAHSQQNRDSFEAIDHAVVVVVLEDEEPQSDDECLRQIGGGDASNRWFDKGIQVIVFRNARSGMNAEHSPAEATMHDAVFGQTVFQRMRELGPWSYPDCYYSPSGSLDKELAFSEIEFSRPAELDLALESAQLRYAADYANFEVRTLKFLEWGADWAKESGLPIDSVVQLALQLAWGRMHGPPCATYETAHLRIHKGARTETCRSTSVESKAWVDAVLAKESPAKVKTLFKQALESQKTYMMECITKAGGCDRHLLGLRILAMQSGQPMPDLFTDPLFTKSSKWRLSTSTVRTTEIGGFPPVYVDGYGICYMFWRTGSAIVAAVSANRSCPETNAAQFVEQIVEALRFIRSNWEHRLTSL